MALMTPEQYRESLRDGRVNYMYGERIEDVTSHPEMKVPVETASQDYDYESPGMRDVRTYQTEDGTDAHRVFQIPRSEEDLHKRVEMMHHTSILGGTTAVYMALMNAREQLGQVKPEYASNVETIYKYARDNDLRAVEAITDAKGDRSRRPVDQDDLDLYTRIVDRTDEGIIVRGAKLHITAACLAHEIVVMPTKAMGPGEEEFSVSFSIPANTPGVKVINQTYAEPDLSTFDYPLSGRHNMPEGFIVFDDVLVPWDRVFLAGEHQLAGVFAHALGLWERIGGLVAMVERSKLLVGIAQLLAEYHGINKAGHIQEKITELIFYAELLRMSLDNALRNYETTEDGMVYPNALEVNVGKYYGASGWHGMMRNIHDISGGIVVTLPSEADLRNEETEGYLRKYLHTKSDVDVEDRMKLINLVRDLTADAYGGWELVTTIQAGGGLAAQKIVTYRNYDLTDAMDAAKEAAGIGT
jgi:4-hydroxybutyryl-CoA dehydratase/vinylacetyl-CoA-Delta-isomerase